MAVKCTFLFQMSTVPIEGKTARTAGWSESWYDTINAIGGQNIRRTAIQYARFRCQMLPPTAKCIGCRFLSTTAKNSIAFPFAVPGNVGSVTDLPQTALLIRIQSAADINHFPFYLRCLPDAVISGGEYTYGGVGGSSFTTRVLGWWRFLAENYRFNGKDLTIPAFEIETIDASGNIELKEEGGIYPVGSKVQVMRTKFEDTCCGGGGVYKVKAVTDLFKLSISGWDGGASHGGKVRAVSDSSFFFPIMAPPSVTDFVGRVVEKKVGRTFDQFRGRRSRTCCR